MCIQRSDDARPKVDVDTRHGLHAQEMTKQVLWTALTERTSETLEDKLLVGQMFTFSLLQSWGVLDGDDDHLLGGHPGVHHYPRHENRNKRYCNMLEQEQQSIGPLRNNTCTKQVAEQHDGYNCYQHICRQCMLILQPIMCAPKYNPSSPILSDMKHGIT